MTEKLKRIYSSNVVDLKAYDTVELQHPRFRKTWYFVQDTKSHVWRATSDQLVTFEPFPFSIQKPPTGGNHQDIIFSFSNINRIGVIELEKAAKDIRTPIKLTYRVFTDDAVDPQIMPLELNLVDISVTAEAIAAVASRVNLFQRSVPSRVFEPWIFKGLA